ncbi:MAG TPA: hypothetical protein VMJ32_12865 [Pirellulales bacterium]|nr:hypothetical protein [Pirellulales bacterium]
MFTGLKRQFAIGLGRGMANAVSPPPTLTAVIGNPGSGKSCYALNLNGQTRHSLLIDTHNAKDTLVERLQQIKSRFNSEIWWRRGEDCSLRSVFEYLENHCMANHVILDALWSFGAGERIPSLLRRLKAFGEKVGVSFVVVHDRDSKAIRRYCDTVVDLRKHSFNFPKWTMKNEQHT